MTPLWARRQENAGLPYKIRSWQPARLHRDRTMTSSNTALFHRHIARSSRVERTTESCFFHGLPLAARSACSLLVPYERKRGRSRGQKRCAWNVSCCIRTYLHGSGLFPMMRTYFMPAGSTRRAMVEDDLAHIEHVLLRTSGDVLECTALPPVYWRERLRQIRDSGQLLEPHLEKINALLLVLDRWLRSGHDNERMGSKWDATRQSKKKPA